MPSRIGLLFYLIVGCSLISAQKKKFEEYNRFIEMLNHKVEYVNEEQQKLQQYHQDFFRYYRIFDTLTVSSYSPRIDSITRVTIPHITEQAYAQFESEFQTFDSLIHSISFEDDLRYTAGKIDSMNLRVRAIEQSTIGIQKAIEAIQNSFVGENFESRKRAYRIMSEEMDKVEFLIEKFKKRKLELVEMEYYIPEKIQKQLPADYLEVLQEFQSRLISCKKGDNKEEIIHYFLPKKYFDIWILKKYNLRYWQVKYLEDILIHPSFERGLKTQYNESVATFSLQKIKSVNQYNSLPFEFIPLTNSPLGRHKKVFLILILDISNSMNENGKLAQLKASVKEFVDALRPQDKFAVILFSNVSQELVLPGERDTEYIKYKIDEIKAFGNTLPESAIFRSYNIMNLQTRKEYDSQVILITDGIFDVTGKMKYHVQMGKKKDIVFSIINIENNGEDYRNLEKLSEISGGKMYFINGSDTYPTLVEEVLRN